MAESLADLFQKILGQRSGKGLLVTLEGIDGCGKSTQADHLVEWLKAGGLPVISSREPTGSVHGKRIRNILAQGKVPNLEQAKTLNDLFMKDRRLHVQELIGPALDQGQLVILDRYYHSNMAYQGAAGLDMQVIRQSNEAFAPKPDLLLLFDLPVQAAEMRRMGRDQPADGFESHVSYQEAVRQAYLSLSDLEYLRVISSENQVDKVVQSVRNTINKWLLFLS